MFKTVKASFICTSKFQTMQRKLTGLCCIFVGHFLVDGVIMVKRINKVDMAAISTYGLLGDQDEQDSVDGMDRADSQYVSFTVAVLLPPLRAFLLLMGLLVTMIFVAKYTKSFR